MRILLVQACIATLASGGCGPAKAADTPADDSVTLVTSTPEGCLEMGSAQGDGANREAAEAELRAAAARQRATHAVVERKPGSSSALSGRLYVCH